MMNIISNHNLVIREQVRFPKSKKRRIQKKWTKDPRNWRTRPDTAIYRINDPWRGEVLIGHPATAARIRAMFAAEPRGLGLGLGFEGVLY